MVRGDHRRDVQAEVRVAELVHLHFDFIWRLLRRFGAPEAEDATQQVFTIAWKKLDEIEAGKERAFLVGIAVRVAADHRKARARRREAGEEAPEVAAPGPDPLELLDQRESRRLLDQILDCLTAELREAFVLSEIEELRIREIAEVLGIPSGTAASRLRRAREAFHVELNRRWPAIERGEP
jgi:RNA polymerase sigma-70 factor (ECF subfamily)